MANRELSTLSVEEIKQTNLSASGYPPDGTAKSLKDVSDGVDSLNELIPSTASADNKLADEAFVNSSINAMAAHKITYDAEGNGFPTKLSLSEATTVYYRGEAYTPVEHDYCTVIADESNNGEQCRYVYDGTQWVFDVRVNDTPFTEAQNEAINSGSTADDIINLREHLEDIDNPHNVTKSQVGLGNVDNTSDMEKPVSNPVSEYIESELSDLEDKVDAINYKGWANMEYSSISGIDSVQRLRNTVIGNIQMIEGAFTPSAGLGTAQINLSEMASNSNYSGRGYRYGGGNVDIVISGYVLSFTFPTSGSIIGFCLTIPVI